MIKKTSTALHNNYASISKITTETKEPIYITKNNENNFMPTSIDASEKREQILQLRTQILQAEQERINGIATLSISQAKKRLKERMRLYT